MQIIYDLINYLDDILLQILIMILPEQISFLFDVINTSTDVFSIISGMTPQQRSYFIKFLIDNNISLNSLFLYFEISLMFTTALICFFRGSQIFASAPSSSSQACSSHTIRVLAQGSSGRCLIIQLYHIA